MDPDDRLRYLFASAFLTGQESDACPEPDVLLGTFDAELPEEQRGPVISHLAECAVCAEAWRLLVLARANP